ncbi:uncharacterized protein A4U43_C01F29020 [Asparagus officinalis]|uniref:Peptidase C1A papain C-terminal domain-containing protein n=1 Tax=Asparagus officinalis TaxID=4686 RepID=A0A5P1FWT9_ASPOF|nr:uncharacterized protein LOC109829091 [Asparagus officinalis]ONK81431.1 uncharacterized protein A4U43_C01F29020 [Asparagus officinalis]
MTTKIVWPDRKTVSFPPDLPEKVDWRNKGVLHEIRDQQNCTCCWALVSCEAISSMDMIKHKREGIKVLSPQDLVNSMEPKDQKKNKKKMVVIFHQLTRPSSTLWIMGSDMNLIVNTWLKKPVILHLHKRGSASLKLRVLSQSRTMIVQIVKYLFLRLFLRTLSPP